MAEAAQEEDDEPTDGREIGQWRTRYPKEAWRIIWRELIYLLTLLAIASIALLFIGCALTADRKVSSVALPLIGGNLDRELLKWIAVSISGMLGGIAFDLKWLYHSVAKCIWNEDRLLWRILVPYISAIVSVFLAFMIVSGIIPFLKADSFNSLYFSLGFGFLFGYFSDGVLAALKKIAHGAFGRTGPTSNE